jgi:hypothetical protein
VPVRVLAHHAPCAIARLSRYGFVVFFVSMDPILPKVGAYGKPGAFQITQKK